MVSTAFLNFEPKKQGSEVFKKKSIHFNGFPRRKENYKKAQQFD